MTDETPRPTSEDTPAPPASTRWSEEPLQEDDSLASPFVPGRSATGATSDLAPPVSGEAPAREAPRPEEGREVTTPEAGPDAFPFDHFDLEGGGQATGQAADEGEGRPGGATTDASEPATTAMGWTPAHMDLDETADEESVQESAEESVQESAVAGPAGEAAEILEHMAELLRSEGLEAVRREMESSHRLTSLLAGLVAGYVSGRS